MRLRRGNYSLLFALSATVLMGFAAYSVDISRLRVARLQTQNAADAGALAALSVLRNGGSQSDATTAAQAVAELNLVLGKDGQFSVAVSVGDWDWDQDPTAAYSDTSDINSVQVSVHQGGDGVVMIFAPIFGDGHSADTVSTTSWAAMRHRDIVVAVDTSYEFRASLPTIKDKVDDFVLQLDEFGQKKDQFGLVSYAGMSLTELSLTAMSSTGVDASRDAIAALDTCSVTQVEWLNWYRYSLGQSHDPTSEHLVTFRPFWPDTVSGGPGMLYGPDDFEMLWPDGLGFVRPPGPPDAELSEWYSYPLVETDQTRLWYASSVLFQTSELNALVLGESPLRCRSGNVHDIGTTGVVTGDFTPQVEDYPVGYTAGARMYPDKAYARAGWNPGAGLQAARVELASAAAEEAASPVVILIASAGAVCHEEIDPGVNCADDWEDLGRDEADTLDDAGVDTYVIAVVEAGSDDEAYLDDLTSGDGELFQLDDVSGIGAVLDTIARRVRVQVVR